jgi:hypothetical protein
VDELLCRLKPVCGYLCFPPLDLLVDAPAGLLIKKFQFLLCPIRYNWERHYARQRFSASHIYTQRSS